MPTKVAKDHVSRLANLSHLLESVGNIFAGRFGMLSIVQHQRDIFFLKSMHLLQIFFHLVDIHGKRVRSDVMAIDIALHGEKNAGGKTTYILDIILTSF